MNNPRERCFDRAHVARTGTLENMRNHILIMNVG